MAFSLKFSTYGAAFGGLASPAHPSDPDYDDGNSPSDKCRAETARILRRVAERIEDGEDVGHYLTVFDIDGNDVGRFRLLQDGEMA